MLFPYTFNILAHLCLLFSCQIIHLKNEKCCVHILRCKGSEKVYVWYTDLNFDNYGQPLRYGDTHRDVRI